MLAYVGVRPSVGKTGSGVPAAKAARLSTDPLQGLKDRLHNWGRSCRAALPELGFSPPPAYDFIYQTLGKGKGKTKEQEAAQAESGTTSDTDDEGIPPIDEADADAIGDALWVMGVGPNAPERFPVGRKQFMVLKRHYFNQRSQPRDLVDAAVRALGDIL